MTTLIARQRSWLFEQTRRQTHLADVMYQAGEMGKALILVCESHSLRDVPRIDRHSSGVSGRVLITGLESRDHRRSKRKVGTLLMGEHRSQFFRGVALLLVQREQFLRHKGWEQE